MRLVSVAVSDATRSFDKLYDYKLSEKDSLIAAPGMRVLVPFGRGDKQLSAWIIRIAEKDDNPKLKKVSQIIDNEPLLTGEMIKIAEWMKTRYFCTWGDAIRIMVPSGINLKKQINIVLRKKDGVFVISEPDLINGTFSKIQLSILKKLFDKPEGIPESTIANNEQGQAELQYLIHRGLVELKEVFDQRINEKTVKAAMPIISKEEFDSLIDEGKVKSIHYIRVMELLYIEGITSLQDILLIAGVSHNTLRSMAKKGWISYCTVEVERNPFDTMVFAKDKPPVLTEEQKSVVEKLTSYLSKNKLTECLLHGVTGSGKTEVYLRLIEHVINIGKTAIVLVPEISLTPQMTSRFTSRFGNKVAIQHSRLSQGERYDQWRKIKAGEVSVVIGARSAIFAPLTKLGIVIIDEEHELSYKSENTPKYDARHVARARCNINCALLVMGSATPSVETYYKALNGKLELLVMKYRANELPLPSVMIVDMKDEQKSGNNSIFSKRLIQELTLSKEKGEQSILFLNRRGYASFLLCRDCGFTLKCPHCSVSLTLHTHDKQAICHYCGYTEKIPLKCPSCFGLDIKAFGSGTQKIEQELAGNSNGYKTIRMDLDTTSGKQGHQKLLDSFRNNEADILIGTQMVAKGHDFPNVTLVGILSADASLFNCDYRASERTFQLITQASGRAGRGSKPGRVIMQAYNVDDYTIQTAIEQDYETFYKHEIAMRKKLFAPPFCHMAQIVVSGENQNDAKEGIDRIRSFIINNSKNDVVYEMSEVVPAPVFIVRNRARWRLIIKMISINKLVQLINDLLNKFVKMRLRGTDLSVDIDPPSML